MSYFENKDFKKANNDLKVLYTFTDYNTYLEHIQEFKFAQHQNTAHTRLIKLCIII